MLIRTIETAAALLSVREAPGPGPAVLMIHGNSGCKEVFESQFNALAGLRHLIAVDLPGHGASSNARNSAQTYTLGGYAACLRDAVSDMVTDPLVVLGHSLGGHISLELSVMLPGVVGMMLCGTPPFDKSAAGLGEAFLPAPAMGLFGKAELSPADVDVLVAALSLGPLANDATIREAIKRTDGVARTTMVGSLLEADAHDQRRLAEQCTVPIAVVNGADDQLVNLDHLDAIAYPNLWSGRAYRIPGAGHTPQLTHPELFNPILERFLQDLST
ncbi:MAG: alpha/beta hydrolase [Devosia sp.]